MLSKKWDRTYKCTKPDISTSALHLTSWLNIHNSWEVVSKLKAELSLKGPRAHLCRSSTHYIQIPCHIFRHTSFQLPNFVQHTQLLLPHIHEHNMTNYNKDSIAVPGPVSKVGCFMCSQPFLTGLCSRVIHNGTFLFI